LLVAAQHGLLDQSTRSCSRARYLDAGFERAVRSMEIEVATGLGRYELAPSSAAASAPALTANW
jgi:hypothetical protein